MKLSDRMRKRVEFCPVALGAINHLASAAERILNRWPDVVADPPERDRERIVQEVLRRLDAGDWAGARMSQVTAAAVALYDEKRRARSDLDRLRDFYCEEISSSDRATFLNAMFAVFIGSYVPNALHTRQLASSLRLAQERIGGRWGILLRSVPECLDPERAHAALATRMMGMASPWEELRALGLRSPHAPGLMDHVHLLFVERTAPTLAERPAIDRFLQWLQPKGQHARASGATEAISALLAPWVNKVPSDDDKHHLIKSVTTMYGDPRVRGENAIWSDVPSDLRAILERWLTGENIRFFLDVVSAVEVSHMWEPRRKFWLGLHEQNRIDAAWVAFSDAAKDHARSRAADNEFLLFGRQSARGTRAKTSLLILKIGSKIVVEGSHDYKVHVFRVDNPRTPKLYEQNYDCEAIRQLPGAWTVSHNGDWQGRVLEQI